MSDNNMELLWCPSKCSESTFEVARWVAQFMWCGVGPAGHMTNSETSSS